MCTVMQVCPLQSLAAHCCPTLTAAASLPQPDGGRQHRDYKPGNMCVRKVGGRWLPVVLDFGACIRQDKDDFFNAMDPR